MSLPVLTTKLSIPRVHASLVVRKRLFDKLQESRNKKLTLLSAPPGFGKTTLISEWIREEQYPAAWLTLDSRDNDLSRFLTYLISAFKMMKANKIEDKVGDLAMAVLQASKPINQELVLTTLINELSDLFDRTGAISSPAYFVLDDYHEISHQPIHAAVDFLIQNAPLDLHTIISSRTDPDLPLARWRVQNAIVEMRASDLKFDLSEASAFLEMATGIQFTHEEISALEARTEGWIAGLQVAALSLKERPDPGGFIQAFTGSNRYILDFLIEEVLKRQSASVQLFLLQTSILDRLSGSLCNSVTDFDNGQLMLEELDRANLFLERLDDVRGWYRYHPLFREFLRALLDSRQPETVSELHRRAAGWFESQGYLAEAVEHALEAVSKEETVPLIERAVREVVVRGEWGTLHDWFESLDEEELKRHPRLCLAQAWASLYTKTLEETEKWLQWTERHFPRFEAAETEAAAEKVQKRAALSRKERDRLLGETIALRATMASMLGDTKKTIGLGKQALAMLPEDDRFLRSAVAQSVGLAHRYKGEAAEAKSAFERAVSLSHEAGNRYQILDGLCNLANIQILEGEYNQAEETIRQGDRLVMLPSGRPSTIASELYLIEGVWLYERNKLERAIQVIVEALRLNSSQRITEMQYGGYIWLSRVLRAQGELSQAEEYMQRAERLAVKADIWRIQAHTEAIRAELALYLEDFDSAASWAGHLDEKRERRPLSLPRMEEFEDLVRAQVYLVLGQPERVFDLLEPLLEPATAAGRMDSVYRMTAQLCLASAETGRSRVSLDRLQWLLQNVERQGYMRLFLDAGPRMEKLLRLAAEKGIEPAYVRRVLVAFGDEYRLSARSKPAADLLSPREMEVLVLIEAGLSNHQISKELVIAIGTVKRHISNIYRKLGVNNRTKALARARELDLIA